MSKPRTFVLTCEFPTGHMFTRCRIATGKSGASLCTWGSDLRATVSRDTLPAFVSMVHAYEGKIVAGLESQS